MDNFCTNYLRSPGSTVQLLGGTYPQWSQSSSCQCTARVSPKYSPFYVSTVLQIVEQNFTGEESVDPAFVPCRPQLYVEITADTRNSFVVCPSDEERTHRQFKSSLPVGETVTVNLRLHNPNLRNVRANVMLPGVYWRDVSMTCSEIPQYSNTNNTQCVCPYTGFMLPGQATAFRGLDNTAKILIGVLVPVGLLILCALLLLLFWLKFGKRGEQEQEKSQQRFEELDVTSSAVFTPSGQINGGFRSASLTSTLPEPHSPVMPSVNPYPGLIPSGFNNGLEVRRPVYQDLNNQPSIMSGRNSASESMSIKSDKVAGHGDVSPYSLNWTGIKSSPSILPVSAVGMDAMRGTGVDNMQDLENSRNRRQFYMETELNDPVRDQVSGEIVKQLLSRQPSNATAQYGIQYDV